MVLKYANKLSDPVIASIVVTPESVIDIKQEYVWFLSFDEFTRSTIYISMSI